MPRAAHRPVHDRPALLATLRTAGLLLSAAPALAQSPLDWIPVSPISAGSDTEMTYDPARQRCVLYGGEWLNTFTGSPLWEWDGARWEARSLGTTQIPEGRALCYDEARRCTVLLDSAGDVWLWDGETLSATAPTTKPPGLEGAALAYDAARQQVVLFGGVVNAGSVQPRDDTWLWDGSDWTLAAPAHRPPPMFWFGMTYDASRQRVVAFGGGNVSANPTLWEWDGTDWSSIQTATGPRGFYSDRLAYDTLRQRLVHFGGRGTWEWDGTAWTSHSANGTGTGCMVYDAARAVTVVFMDVTAETRTWDGTNWATWHVGAPDPYYFLRSDAALATDPVRGQIMTFGGYHLGSSWNRITSDQTLTWDGHAWTESSPAVSPPARSHHGLFMELSSQSRVILFGGADDGFQALQDTWAWDGTGWSRLQTTSQPSARFDFGVTFDVGRGRGVLFGGRADSATPPFDDTWEWDGASWTLRQPATRPPARSRLSLAHDPLRGRTVLFGGEDAGGVLADTWEYDGVDWRRIQSATTPPARSGGALAWDEAQRRIVLFGGADAAGGRLADTWTWDGRDWTSLTTSTAPTSFFGDPSLAFDPVRQTMLVRYGAPVSWVLASAPIRARSGSGCAPGGGPIPVLQATEARFGNEAFHLDVLEAPAGAVCVLGVAVTAAATPLGNGCTLYLGAPLATAAGSANAHGGFGVRLPLPPFAALRGVTLHAQAAVAAPGGSYSWTGAVSATVGD